jgi:hypothetical protein
MCDARRGAVHAVQAFNWQQGVTNIDVHHSVTTDVHLVVVIQPDEGCQVYRRNVTLSRGEALHLPNTTHKMNETTKFQLRFQYGYNCVAITPQQLAGEEERRTEEGKGGKGQGGEGKL